MSLKKSATGLSVSQSSMPLDRELEDGEGVGLGDELLVGVALVPLSGVAVAALVGVLLGVGVTVAVLVGVFELVGVGLLVRVGVLVGTAKREGLGIGV